MVGGALPGPGYEPRGSHLPPSGQTPEHSGRGLSPRASAGSCPPIKGDQLLSNLPRGLYPHTALGPGPEQHALYLTA